VQEIVFWIVRNVLKAATAGGGKTLKWFSAHPRSAVLGRYLLSLRSSVSKHRLIKSLRTNNHLHQAMRDCKDEKIRIGVNATPTTRLTHRSVANGCWIYRTGLCIDRITHRRSGGRRCSNLQHWNVGLVLVVDPVLVRFQSGTWSTVVSLCSELCVRGPLGIYRMSIVADVMDSWVRQSFLGVLCTYGDDRHLTDLVLREGYKVKLSHYAIHNCKTIVHRRPGGTILLLGILQNPTRYYQHAPLAEGKAPLFSVGALAVFSLAYLSSYLWFFVRTDAHHPRLQTRFFVRGAVREHDQLCLGGWQKKSC